MRRKGGKKGTKLINCENINDICMPFACILQILKFMHFFTQSRNVEFHALFGGVKIMETPPSLNPGYITVKGMNPLGFIAPTPRPVPE